MKLWKLQKFFGDVVYDLRNRGLLPVVILLLVAMVAVPVVISRGSSDSAAPAIQPAGGFTDLAPEAKSAVVSYSPPGIRDYRRRLDQLSPEDPFRQQFARSAAKAAELTGTSVASTATTGSSSSGSASTGSGSVVSTGGGTGGSTGSSPSKKRKKKSKTTYTYSVNVLAGDVTTTLTPFNDLASLTPLPAQTTPVVVYYGLSSDYGKALFLVSNKVDTLTGPGTCVPAPDDCSLLALGPGESEDLHYTKDDKTYRLVVAEIKRVAK